MQETELIEACAHNDRSSQKIFYDRYCPLIMGMCVRYAGNSRDAESMAVFVFKRLFENISACPLDGSTEQWIAQNVIWYAVQYLHQDRQKYFIAKTTMYSENKPVEARDIEQVELPADVGKKLYLSSLQALTPSYRILYNLTYIDEVPPDNIVKKLEIGEETYKTELSEARYQFKKLLTTRLNEQNIR